MIKEHFEDWKDIVEPFLEVRGLLDRKMFSVNETIAILGITKRQFYYWVSISGHRKQKGHEWIKLSIIDIFGLAILRELRKQNVTIDIYDELFEWVLYNIYVRPYFLHHFMEGDPIYLIYNKSKSKFTHYYESLKKEYELLSGSIAEPIIVLPISPLLRDILSKTHIEGVSIRFSEDKFGNKNKVNCAIFDDEFMKIFLEIPDNIFSLMHPHVLEKKEDIKWFKKYHCWRELSMKDSSEIFSHENQYEKYTDYLGKYQITATDHPPTSRLRMFKRKK